MIETLIAKSIEGLSSLETISKSELGRLAEKIDVKNINKEILDSPLENSFESFVENEQKNSLIDNNGDIYAINGDLMANSKYELNGVSYMTDELGRPIYIEASNLQISPDNIRDSSAQRYVGGIDRRPTDHGGHLISREFGGDSGIGNLVAMDSRINQSDYRQMENFVGNLIENDTLKSHKIDINYSGLSNRPDSIFVEIQCENNELFQYKFNNNMDQSFKGLVSDNAKEMVNTIFEDKQDGLISSIRNHYDSSGNLSDEQYNITYNDEGITKRTMVKVNHNI